MKQTIITISLLLTLGLSQPLQAFAFWGIDKDSHKTLNLKSGYDINTVITVKGHIINIQADDDRPSLQIELETDGASIFISTGPPHYWQEHGIPLSTGDEITVRGSKAQENDGAIYIIAQEITNTTQHASVTLRDESGRPAWAGKGRRQNQGQSRNRSRQ
ncbi:MAG: hypothetical protein KKD63_01860 [Proteobacteria bacterium]|nr:hypothetical protein [Desulfobulbaceae bacterium]MBU4151605.1 hypothetical protein [Pseudomonadota bacterium]